MIDNTHFNPTWDTHNNNPPLTRSIFTEVQVPYDRYKHEKITQILCLLISPSISNELFAGVHSSRDIDVDTVWKSTLPNFFSEDMESLQLLEVFSTDYYSLFIY